jgi:hypothetical protein
MQPEVGPEQQQRRNGVPFVLDTKTLLIGLVVLSGGGNLWFTKAAGDQTTEEAAGTTRQIQEMHQTLAEFKDRISEIDKRWSNMDTRAGELLNQQQELLRLVRALSDREELQRPRSPRSLDRPPPDNQ